ncbi:unannotated protein [freshwater metagenome]|uniref:Unannotated protein n=1 Tax=freshwater metagenome TaxID=449393 RepID=A0A6J6UY94_9ZZZZ
MPSNSRIVAGAPCTISGSPGPFDKKIPFGDNAITSSAVVVAGTTCTVANSAKQFNIVVFIPKSYATTVNFPLP